MSQYVSSLNVVPNGSIPTPVDGALTCYGTNGDALIPNNNDTNMGFGGSFVWITANKTDDRSKAATGFSVWVQDKKDDTNGGSMSDGTNYPDEPWPPLSSRYVKNADGAAPVETVALLRSGKENPQSHPPANLNAFAYLSGDINQGRGGDYLYIMWGPPAL